MRLAGIVDPRIETYRIDRRDDSYKVIGQVHCTRCQECGEIHYMDLVQAP